MKYSVYIYPWDIVDEGISETLRRLKDIGFNSISLAVSYHTAKLFLPHNPKTKVYYHASGRVYFQPDFDKYKTLLPELGEAFNEYKSISRQDLLAKIIEEARKLKMGVRAWIVGLHNSRLGHLYPQYAIQNVFGEPYYHGLCPNQPEVRHYINQMVEDLVTKYDLDGIELEAFNFMGFHHGDHHEMVGTADLERLEKVLSLCFCEECCKKAKDAGVPLEVFKENIKNAVLNEAEIEDMIEYNRYIKMRIDSVSEIYRDVNNILVKAQKKVFLYGIYYGTDTIAQRLYGMDPAKQNPYVDGWVVIYPESSENVRAFAATAREHIACDGRHLIGGLRMMSSHLGFNNELSEYIRNYQSAGVEGINFYNYGLTANTVLDKVKESLCL